MLHQSNLRARAAGGCVAPGLATLCMSLGLSLVLGTSAHAQSADTVGVHYTQAIKVEGTPLTLNGTGVSYRAVAKLYTVGLYVPQKSSKADVIFSADRKSVV